MEFFKYLQKLAGIDQNNKSKTVSHMCIVYSRSRLDIRGVHGPGKTPCGSPGGLTPLIFGIFGFRKILGLHKKTPCYTIRTALIAKSGTTCKKPYIRPVLDWSLYVQN